MEHSVEHAKATEGSIKSLIKINDVRKCEGSMLPCESLGSRGNELTTCERHTNKISGVRFVSARCEVVIWGKM